MTRQSHIDVAMHAPTERDEAQVAAELREREQEKSQLMVKARLLQELQQHPGWHLFVESMRAERNEYLAMLERSNDPTTLAKTAGMLVVNEAFADFPQREAARCFTRVKDLTEDE